MIATPLIAGLAVLCGIIITAIADKIVQFADGQNTLSVAVLNAIILISVIILVLIFWVFHLQKKELPQNLFERFLPIGIAFSYYMTVWILLLAIAQYSFLNAVFGKPFFALTAPYIGPNIFYGIASDFTMFPYIQIAAYGAAAVAIIIVSVRYQKPMTGKRAGVIFIAVFIAFSSAAVYQNHERNNRIVPNDDVARIAEDYSIYAYSPFVEGNRLEVFGEEPTLTIESDYPKLDGATAAYPVYAAISQGIYKGLDEYSVKDFVECTTTSKAYERLMDGEIDILFGAQPSKQQLENAAKKGLELTLTPIAKEAFVFFVNSENSVDDLTIEQIQDIYQKKITNWKEVNGVNKRIIAFQRPENSGSQTIMLAMVMDGKPLPEPILEEYSSLMGGMISEVAAYRNYESAIGYSFRYYATAMRPDAGIKLISIDGIEPSVENIRSGAYPLTVEVYAVTAGTENGNSEKLIAWILSEQGQSFIEQCGYVRIN